MIDLNLKEIIEMAEADLTASEDEFDWDSVDYWIETVIQLATHLLEIYTERFKFQDLENGLMVGYDPETKVSAVGTDMSEIVDSLLKALEGHINAQRQQQEKEVSTANVYVTGALGYDDFESRRENFIKEWGCGTPFSPNLSG